MLKKILGMLFESANKDISKSSNPEEISHASDIREPKYEENIVLVLDVSGSMETADYPPNRLRAAKIASSEFIKEKIKINHSAKVGIVAFSDFGRVVNDIVFAKDNLILLQNSLDRLKIKGGTDIAIGLKYAFDLLLKNAMPGALNRIILLTDGHGGHPIRVSEVIKSMGIVIQIIGIGGCPNDVNERLLKKIASFAGGKIQYRFIGDKDSLVEHFRSLATNITK